MRIIRFLDPEGHEQLGQDLGDGTADLLDGGLFAEDGRLPKASGQTAKIAKLLAPLQPSNIFCIGLNYREHAKEGGLPVPEFPVLFAKPTTALNNPHGPIRIPAVCVQEPEVDYECELAVIIGKRGRDISEADALHHVLGYTCANDVSARFWQLKRGGGQWIRGKGFDTFCPLGPALVTTDQIPDPQALRLTTTLNGELMQDGHTSDMVFSVAQLISFMSQDTTLLPGTVILTGTPHGIGFARKPPILLKPNDQVVIEVEGIGKLENPVEAATA